MRVLITGVNGFVGEHLSKHLQSKKIDVCGTIIIGDCNNKNVQVEHLDLLDEKSTLDVVSKLKPDGIYHLAGQSNVGVSWKQPAMTMNINIMGAVNLLEAVRKAVPKTRVLIIGTSDQYGIVTPDMCPLNEEIPINPQSPYALSKVIQEQVAKYYIKKYRLDIVMVRAFNHIGVGQNLGFVVPDFASKIARIELGLMQKMLVGNLEAIRDFSDVKDIVRGYELLMDKGRCGEVYNIGSGKPRRISDILNIMISYAKKEIEIEQDFNLIRPADAPVIYADCSKIVADIGYESRTNLEITLREIIEDWRIREKINLKNIKL